MANKPLRPCHKAGCNTLTSNKYCEEHMPQSKYESNRYYDKYKRNKKSKAFYNSKEWGLVRQQALARDHGLCQHCLSNKKITRAEMVDHIIPILVDWSKRLTLINLQSLCDTCHKIKTAEDKKKYVGTPGL